MPDDHLQKQLAQIDKKHDQPFEQEPEGEDVRSSFTLPAWDKIDDRREHRDHNELTRSTDVVDRESLLGIATGAAYADTHSHVSGDAQQDVIEEAVAQTLTEWIECKHHFVFHTCLECTPRDASGRKRTAAPKSQIEFTAYGYAKGKPPCGLARLAQRCSSTIRKQRLKFESLVIPDIDDDENVRFSDNGTGQRLIEAQAFGGSGYDWKTHWRVWHSTSVWKSCLRVGFPPGCEPTAPTRRATPRTLRAATAGCKHSWTLTPATCAHCLKLARGGLTPDGRPFPVWVPPTFEVIPLEIVSAA